MDQPSNQAAPLARRVFLLAAVLVGLQAAGGCGKAISADAGSETHWLVRCDLDAECGAASSCECGICSRSCVLGADCAALGIPGVQCVARPESCEAPQPSYREPPESSVCLLLCGDDDDCAALGNDASCEAGRCELPSGAVTAGGGSSGGSGRSSSSSSGGGSSSSGGGGSGSGVAGTSGSLVRGCPGARSQSTGVEECADGVLHRTGPVQCSSLLRRFNEDQLVQLATYLASGGDPANVQCMGEADCSERPLGYCVFGDRGDRPLLTHCEYGCVSDDDCDVGEACACGAIFVGSCKTSGCRGDASCAPGFACTQWTDPRPFEDCYGYELSCETAADECRTSADCPEGLACKSIDGRRACGQPVMCPIHLD